MGKVSTGSGQMTIGVDVGDRFSRFCVLGEDGAVEEEGRVATTPAALQRSFGSRLRARVVLEVGPHSPWTSRLLEECGHEVLVANPAKLRMIYQNSKKSDRVDAESLARVGRMDPRLLAPIRHRGAVAQADLAILRARQATVRARTLLVNHVRGTVKAFGARVSTCSARCFHKRDLDEIPKELAPAVSPLLSVIGQLTTEISRFDRQIETLANERYPETHLLQQVPGVGPVTAMTYVLTLEDPRRFRNSRVVGAYLGLCPRQSASGDQDPQLRITREGDSNLRRLLVCAAHYILGPFGPDSDLRRKGQEIALRGGKNAKKRAIIAVARKLAVLLHRLWLTGEVYEPLRNRTIGELRQQASA